MQVEFFKYHGLGNDFIIVDSAVFQPSPEQVRRLCDRRTGVGGDGIIVSLPPLEHSARMRVFNADGSVAGMCGNGLRCMVRWLYDYRQSARIPSKHESTSTDHHGEPGVLSPPSSSGGAHELVVETDAGPHVCRLNLDETGQLSSIRVLMSSPRFEPGNIPMISPGHDPSISTRPGAPHPAHRRVDGELDVFGVWLGNPHGVLFVNQVDEARVATVGRLLAHHDMFPERANIEFVKVHDSRTLEVGVYERGVGPTLACGTGACAAAVVAAALGRVLVGHPIMVDLPGGRLQVIIENDFETVWHEGPAVFVFKGLLNTTDF